MRDVTADQLKGVSVVEIGESTGASFMGSLLAECGAEVTKVRSHEAGAAELPTEADAYLRARDHYLNRNKTVITVGTANLRGEIDRLVASADVLIRDGEGAGVEPPTRREYEGYARIRQGLIYVLLSPFGATGPCRDWSGDDINVQTFSGFASLIGDDRRAPLVAPYDLAGFSHGLHGAAAAVAMLLERTRTGKGAFVDIAASEVMAAYTRMYSLLYRFYGIPLVRSGRRAPGSGGRYPMTILPCKDGYVVLIARSGREWGRFLEMMGNPEWSNNPRYRDPLAIALEYPDEVDDLLCPWLAERTRLELLRLAQEHGVPMAPVRSIDEVLEDVQLRFRRFFSTLVVGDREVLVPGLPNKTLA